MVEYSNEIHDGNGPATLPKVTERSLINTPDRSGFVPQPLPDMIQRRPGSLPPGATVTVFDRAGKPIYQSVNPTPRKNG